MKTHIWYLSKAGASKQYAEWLNEDISDSILSDLEQVDISVLESSDRLIIVSRTYMGEIGARSFLEKNWDSLKQNRVYLVEVGLMDPDSKEGKKAYELLDERVRGGLAGHTKLPGRTRQEGLNLAEKLITKIVKIKLFGNFGREALVSVKQMLGE